MTFVIDTVSRKDYNAIVDTVSTERREKSIMFKGTPEINVIRSGEKEMK